MIKTAVKLASDRAATRRPKPRPHYYNVRFSGRWPHDFTFIPPASVRSGPLELWARGKESGGTVLYEVPQRDVKAFKAKAKACRSISHYARTGNWEWEEARVVYPDISTLAANHRTGLRKGYYLALRRAEKARRWRAEPPAQPPLPSWSPEEISSAVDTILLVALAGFVLLCGSKAGPLAEFIVAVGVYLVILVSRYVISKICKVKK